MYYDICITCYQWSLYFYLFFLSRFILNRWHFSFSLECFCFVCLEQKQNNPPPKKNPKHCLLDIRSTGISIHKYLVYLNGALCDNFFVAPFTYCRRWKCMPVIADVKFYYACIYCRLQKYIPKFAAYVIVQSPNNVKRKRLYLYILTERESLRERVLYFTPYQQYSIQRESNISNLYLYKVTIVYLIWQ